MTLGRLIKEEIGARGPISFDRFMELALYHPDLGYYAGATERVGWRGDFVTSPELDPAFGGLWARAFEQIWEQCGSPDSFDIVEVGPGEGVFPVAVLGALSDELAGACRYHMVERSPEASKRQRTRLQEVPKVIWHASFDDVPPLETGCIFVNEVVDNLPVRLAERRAHETRELLVGVSGESLQFVLGEEASPTLAAFFDALKCEIPEGHRAEVSTAAMEFVGTAADRLHRGAIAIVDYGDHARDLVNRPAGTLLCYSKAGVADRPLEAPGTKDITAHANWTALRSALDARGLRVAGPIAQADVLRSLGWTGVAAQLRDRSHSGAGRDVLRALSRRGAIAALVDPGGLGGLGVLIGTKGCELPGFAHETHPLAPSA